MDQAANERNLRFSNFLITFSTNVRPADAHEEVALTNWLVDMTDRMFNQWDILNGTVIKPAGSPNEDKMAFPIDNQIIMARSRITIERGDFNQGHGQMHAHILLEVAHNYTDQRHGAAGAGTDHPERLNLGVHTNVRAMRDYLNERIVEMDIDIDRRPKKIYVNSKLLTKGTDLSNKWLTLAYIRKNLAKGVDGQVLNLRQLEHDAHDPELSRVRQGMINGGQQGPPIEHDLEPISFNVNLPSPPNWRHNNNIPMGGAIGGPLPTRPLKPGKYK
jgi:hypothetical protein